MVTHKIDRSQPKLNSSRSPAHPPHPRPEAPASPAALENLDQLIQVVSPKRWLSLVALSTLVATGLGWSIFGRIPVTVRGQGVLVYPSKIVNFQSPSSGRLLTLAVKPGDRVTKGQLLATIDQSELQKELQLNREKLIQLQIQDQQASAAQAQRETSEQTAITGQRAALQQSLATVQALTPELRQKGLESIQRERQALEQRLQTLRDLLPTYQQRWAARQEAREQGAISKDMLLEAQEDFMRKKAEIAQLESELKQLDVKEADAQRAYLDNLNRVNELQAQIKELDSRIASQSEQDLVNRANRRKEMQETQRAVSQLDAQIRQNSQVVSVADGTILELTVKPGEQLQPGAGIGTLASATADHLVSVIFVPARDGKKLTPGMQVQTTPTIVKREEFGGILGKVTEVSTFPISQQGAASLVGNPDILPGLLEEGAQIAVFAELQPGATPDTYRWSSQSPPQKITAGMTTTVQIKVEERSPISYVMPVLKSLTGLS